MSHPVQWTSPQPMWGRFAAGTSSPFRADDQARPALLRFASDDFMQQVIATLETDPRRIGEAIARPETWRNPPTDAPVVEQVRLPKPTRMLARLRAGTAPKTALTATTAQAEAAVNGVKRVLPLKLYQPAHGRFYLVAANLVCRVPGLPDHTLAAGGREQVGFMLRRLFPASAAAGAPMVEYAFVKDARGARWVRVPADGPASDPYAREVRGEELLPLFPMNFADDAGFPRRIHSGLVPVGRREEYMSGKRTETTPASGGTAVVGLGSAATADPATKKSARKEQLKLDVAEPWKALIRATYKAAARIDLGDPPVSGVSASDITKSTLQHNESAQHQSWLVLLDFADYLAHHLPAVWAAVQSGATTVTPADGGQQKLLAWLNSSGTAPGGGWRLSPQSKFATGMADALRRVVAARAGLEGADRTFVSSRLGLDGWPGFYYLLAGVREQVEGIRLRYRAAGPYASLASADAPTPGELEVEALPEGLNDLTTQAEAAAAVVDKLVQLVTVALPVESTSVAPPVPFAVQLRDALTTTVGDPGWFVIRCVYCPCDCGPLDPSVLSAPSQRFQLANFFDSDAPARPIRISLPIDTTPAGMRKHPKSTAFILSDALCGQVNRLKGLGFVDLVLSVLPWPFHKDLDIGPTGIGPCKKGEVDIGMICSLSIPIITICALILLFMIVLVLDFIFKWIPWFIICFPLPKFKAKEATS